MINTASEIMDKIISWLLLPATIYGACGAFLRSRHRGKTFSQTGIEIFGGTVIANVTMPIVQQYAPQSWQWTAFFLVGWGGLYLVEAIYGVALRILNHKIHKHFGIDIEKKDIDP